MPNKQIRGVTAFNPMTDIPSLTGKIILVSGGTAGLGSESIKALLGHDPGHIYFTGRNATAAEALISEVKQSHPNVGLTFIKIDLSSLQSVKDGVAKGFKHDRLDLLLNNAGIICKPPVLSVDGYEIQFATNHLGHAMLTKQLLPHLLRAAETPNSDVRIVTLSSDGYEGHRAIKGGISFEELGSGGTMSRIFLGTWLRYGQSKLANILFASEFARRYPQITSVSLHPGVVKTPMVNGMDSFNGWFNTIMCWLAGIKMMEPHEGAYNQLWCAFGAEKAELKNGGFYRPVGVDATMDLKGHGANIELAIKLWDWTENILAKFD
ncbi:hypothetical protein DE146DRAFT_217888 [Phaeosphaeria sp. MPI-PUGE-AT-0046c]|nr:hypothetical protein DE146DRAFT_217888 [Phaeosphaeria sp. MPI-PUGE-AT-0046c]